MPTKMTVGELLAALSEYPTEAVILLTISGETPDFDGHADLAAVSYEQDHDTEDMFVRLSGYSDDDADTGAPVSNAQPESASHWIDDLPASPLDGLVLVTKPSDMVMDIGGQWMRRDELEALYGVGRAAA